MIQGRITLKSVLSNESKQDKSSDKFNKERIESNMRNPTTQYIKHEAEFHRNSEKPRRELKMTRRAAQYYGRGLRYLEMW